MKINQYNEYHKLFKQTIFKDGSYGLIRPQIHKLAVGQQNIVFIDLICKQLQTAFVNKYSRVVNRATFIFADLAYLDDFHLTLRMGQKVFQQNLIYTLRRRTSLIGNKITMHVDLWEEIQKRVLRVYKFWCGKHINDEQKYHNILQKYRYIVNKKIQFPPEQDIAMQQYFHEKQVANEQQNEQSNEKAQQKGNIEQQSHSHLFGNKKQEVTG